MTEPKITPLARRLAEENGIDWRSLEGTGPDGAIVERDILAFLAKVMAGEVELPPEPTEAPPPEAIPDLSQVEEALAREGVDVGELVPPKMTQETPLEQAEGAGVGVFVEEAEEEAIFEVDFEALVEETEEVEEPAQTPTPAEQAAPEFSESEDDGWSMIETELEPAPQGPAAEPGTHEPPLWETLPTEEPTSTDPTLEWETEGIEGPPVTEGEAPPEPAAAEEAGGAEELQLDEVEEVLAEEVDFDEDHLETTPEPAHPPEGSAESEEPAETAASEPVDAGPPEVAEPTTIEPAVEETASQEVQEESAPAGETAPREEASAFREGATPVVFPPAFRRAVDLKAALRAQSDLTTAWRQDVPLELLLFRAVDRALAELEVPMRPALGRFEGEEARSLAVQPALGLRDLFENLLAAEEGGEGLIVLDLSETPYAEVILPERVLITLGRAGLPQNLGLLSISGELPTDRTRFLERVAFYLERPILLA